MWNDTEIIAEANIATAAILAINKSEQDICPTPEKIRYPSVIGIDLAVPQWQAILITIILSFIIILTIIGNVLVILSVFTYKPLRIVQNFFIVSLAVADLTVAILVLPFNVANMMIGRWIFGIHLCKMWLTSDVLCCTSSILNLCAIALDRYWAITDPINYAQKRTVERVLMLIGGVWILSLVIRWIEYYLLFKLNLSPIFFTLTEVLTCCLVVLPCKLQWSGHTFVLNFSFLFLNFLFSRPSSSFLILYLFFVVLFNFVVSSSTRSFCSDNFRQEN